MLGRKFVQYIVLELKDASFERIKIKLETGGFLLFSRKTNIQSPIFVKYEMYIYMISGERIFTKGR